MFSSTTSFWDLFCYYGTSYLPSSSIFHYPILKLETSFPRSWATKSKQKDHVKTNKTTQLLGFVQESVLCKQLSSQIIIHVVNALEKFKISHYPCFSIEQINIRLLHLTEQVSFFIGIALNLLIHNFGKFQKLLLWLFKLMTTHTTCNLHTLKPPNSCKCN